MTVKSTPSFTNSLSLPRCTATVEALDTIKTFIGPAGFEVDLAASFATISCKEEQFSLHARKGVRSVRSQA